MVNPGTFKGLRKEFLDSQQEVYAAAVKGSHIADTLADIQRRYFKRFPVTLPHTEEPTKEFLDSVDDDDADPELKPPEADGLDPEAKERAVRLYEFHVTELKMRKEQIKRRLHYQYSKAQGQKAKFEMGSNDPMAILAAQLTGSSTQKPRQKTAYNLWGPENRSFIDPIFNERVKEGNVPAKQQAALRSSIYKEKFEELPEDERNEWVERAEREHQQALKKFNKTLKAKPSTAPEDRQRQVIRCSYLNSFSSFIPTRIIECLARFMQPILDLLADHSGWKVSLIAGGPEPADGGRLHMISVHAGATSGSVPMNFGRSERVAYKDVIVPIFARFLRKCYSVQECRDRALQENGDFVGLTGVEDDEGFEVYSLDDDHEEEYVKVTNPRKQPAEAVRASSSKAKASTSVKVGGGGLPVKFGPPKGSKKSTAPAAASASTEKALGKKPSNSTPPPGKLSEPSNPACASRGPTPPASRPATPVMDVDDNSAPAPSKLDRPQSGRQSGQGSSVPLRAASAAPQGIPALGINIVPHRAASAQPAPLNWDGPSFLTPASDAPPVPEQPASSSMVLELMQGHAMDVDTSQGMDARPPTCSRSPEACTGSPPTVSTGPLALPDANNTTPKQQHATSAPMVPTGASALSASMASAASSAAMASAAPASSTASIASSASTIPAVSSASAAPAASSLSMNPITAPHSTMPAATSSATGCTTPAGISPASMASAASSASTIPAVPSAAAAPPVPSPSMNPPAAPHSTTLAATSSATGRTAPAGVSPGSVAVPDLQPQPEADKSQRNARKRKGPLLAKTDQKQRRTSNQGSSASSNVSARPPWVVNALELLKTADLGPEWDTLISNWLKFEESAGFQGSGKLGTKHRPSVISDWIRRARSPKFSPEIDNLVDFAADFSSWWQSLQPEWRRGNPTSNSSQPDGHWDDIRRPGINGLLSVVAALFFWGNAAQGAAVASRPAWLEAAQDVSYVLEQLI